MEFTIAQIAEIRRLNDLAISDQIKWAEVYQYVSDQLGEYLGLFDPLHEDFDEVGPVQAWFAGAALVNADTGAYSEFIREYSSRQAQLLLGENVSGYDPHGPLMDFASNRVAYQRGQSN